MEDNKSISEQSEEKLQQKRMLLNYILTKIFSSEDITDQLHHVYEPKKEELSLPPQPEQPRTPAPVRFKALMEKMVQKEENSIKEPEGE